MLNVHLKFGLSRIVLVALLLAAGTAATYAQSGAGYDLSWWTVDGGGGLVSGGGYAVLGTAGQPDAGPGVGGGGYTLRGGFWPAGGDTGASYRVYLPIVVRNP